MKITNNQIVISIDDEKAEYSAYLRGILGLMDQDIIDVGLIGDAVYIDVSSDVLENFVDFLDGLPNIRMTVEDEGFFSYMGIPNTHEYPLDYWAVKVRDNWIRDNMYKLNLFEDPYYGLIEVPIDPEALAKIEEYLFIDSIDRYIGNELMLAGGAAVYLSGTINKLKDIDLFFVATRDKAIRVINSILHPVDDNTAVPYSTPTAFDRFINFGISTNAITAVTERARYELILRLYRAPTEIVHGFDLDCVGMIYDGKNLYATERAIYSMKNRVNWFDPKRASPSYTPRLLKYHLRGYHVMLPSLDLSLINRGLVTDHIDRLMKIYLACNRDYLSSGEALNTKYMIPIMNLMRKLPRGNQPVGITSATTALRLALTENQYLTAHSSLALRLLPDRHPELATGSTKYLYQQRDITDGRFSFVIRDKTSAILEGLEIIYNILGLRTPTGKVDPDEFPFIRDQLGEWYEVGKYNEGQMVGFISKVVKEMRYPTSKRVVPDLLHRGHIIPEPSFLIDDASLLILAFAYDIVYKAKSVSHDYLGDGDVEPIFKESTSIVRVVEDLHKAEYGELSDSEFIKFVEQNPMTQLTSTFHPEPVLNIQEFYENSGYYDKPYKRKLFPFQNL